jgi:hypothetical protein
VKRGASLPGPYTHLSTLRLIEDSFGLPHLRAAARPEVKSLEPAFKAGVPRVP